MTDYFVRFVNHLDPNFADAETGVRWPPYSSSGRSEGLNPSNVLVDDHLEPSTEAGVQLPPSNSSARLTLEFNEGSIPLSVRVDDQRAAGIKELTSLALWFPF